MPSIAPCKRWSKARSSPSPPRRSISPPPAACQRAGGRAAAGPARWQARRAGDTRRPQHRGGARLRAAAAAGRPAVGPPLLAGPGHDAAGRRPSRKRRSTACPSRSKAAVVPGGEIRVRVPAHELMLRVMRLLAGPVVMVGARRPQDGDSVTAQEVVARLGEQRRCRARRRPLQVRPAVDHRPGR